MLALAAAAWAGLVWLGLRGFLTGGGAHSHGMASSGAGATALLAGLGHWLLMVVAMMFPLLVPSVRVAAFRSLRRRRHRAILLFLSGYLATWTLLGLATSGLLIAVPQLSDGLQAGAAAAAFLLAALWQGTEWKRRALVACHWTMPLAPTGLKADRDCLRFGWRIGGACCLSCWLLMLACTLCGHSILALVGCAAVGSAERTADPRTRRLIVFGILAMALFFGPLGIGLPD